MPDQAVQDVKLAVSEAATNAVIHGTIGEGAMVRVSACHKDHELTIVITDTGSGIVPRADSPGLGLGLPIIASVTKRLEITYAGGTSIEMVFHCPGGLGAA